MAKIDHTFEGLATNRDPVYLVQPHDKSAPPDINRKPNLLLGENLDAVSLFTAPFGSTGYQRTDLLRVKSDFPRGIRIAGSGRTAPYDASWNIGGEAESFAFIKAMNNGFSCKIHAVAGGKAKIAAREISLSKPTLIINRSSLYHDKIAPELSRAQSNPHFGRVRLIQFTFQELTKAVIDNIPEEEYLFVDYMVPGGRIGLPTP